MYVLDAGGLRSLLFRAVLHAAPHFSFLLRGGLPLSSGGGDFALGFLVEAAGQQGAE